MKVVLLAGGYGTRISEESHLKPKPMIEIGGKPILWHIMKIYSHYGFNEFVICLGYKGFVIKEYFANYFLHSSDITFSFNGSNQVTYHNQHAEPWKVTLIDTGADTMTGGRLKKVRPYLDEKPFMMTYGDGVSNINIADLVEFHKNNNKIVTVSATQPSGRYGSLSLAANNIVDSFLEKPKGDGFWVNAGFFVLQPEIFNYLIDDNTIFEGYPLEILAKAGQLVAYKHTGFWQSMDSLRDKNLLEDYWKSGKAQWKIWT
jgi:glucose-1-phosphate cytidylyltransferase